MKVTMFGRDGQVDCYNCGHQFVPEIGAVPTSAGILTTKCIHCNSNRGSWLQEQADRDFCIAVDVDIYLEVARIRAEATLKSLSDVDLLKAIKAINKVAYNS